MGEVLHKCGRRGREGTCREEDKIEEYFCDIFTIENAQK